MAPGTKHYVLLWIPSHMGIHGNERTDNLAKEATNKNITKNFHFIPKDIKTKIKQITNKIFEKWWTDTKGSNKLKEISKTLPKWANNNVLCRNDSVKLTRLSIGHTTETHKFIFEKTSPPICACSNTLTIKHLYTECTHYKYLRDKYGIKNQQILTKDKKYRRNIVKIILISTKKKLFLALKY